MPSRHDESWIPSFIASLRRAQEADDRATLAKLRRGLSDHPAERDVWVYANLRGARPDQEPWALLIASLFATHPAPAAAANATLGAALRAARSGTAAESLDKRFAVTLDSHADDLPNRLRQVVSLLRSYGVPIDWARLLRDLLDWDHPGRPVQRAWARDYWVGRALEAHPKPKLNPRPPGRIEPMIVELHMLQNFAPSCLNRDDTNTPKDCEFGGVRRARISSQCIKRAIRRHFREAQLLRPIELAHRTKRLVDQLVPALRRDGRTDDAIRAAATRALAGGGLKLDDDHQTQYLLFLGQAEIDGLTALIDAHWDQLAAPDAAAAAPAPAPEKKPKTAKQQKAQAKDAVPDDVRKGVLKLLDGGKAADLALFGRMLADLPDKNVDAACQVAHALSANRAAIEMDYFTAVDDLKPQDGDAGAGMIGNVEFNSSCFYRYANVDTDQLLKNLGGDTELASRTVMAFLRASVEAIPTGKQNTFAAHNPPDLVLAVVRRRGQTNLANAFVRPVRAPAEGSLVDEAARALDAYWKQSQKIAPLPDGAVVSVVTTSAAALPNLKDHERDSLDQVLAAVGNALGEAA